jgi:hypothetical protein
MNRPRGHGTPHNKGYWVIEQNGRAALRHILIAEKAIGRRLNAGNEVHHVDGDRGNDANRNLVICENRSYHQLLHRRERALRTCGHATWRSCNICHQYDDPSNLRIYLTSNSIIHLRCLPLRPRKKRL